MLLAVPGSGKTTVILARIAYLLTQQEVNPRNIITLTFNKDCTANMEKYFNVLFDNLFSATPTFTTLHSFCNRVIVKFCKDYHKTMPSIIDKSTYSSDAILSNIYLSFNKKKPQLEEIDDIKKTISYAANMCLISDEITKICSIPKITDIMQEYKNFKRENNIFDFDDMLEYCLTIFITYPQVLSYYQRLYMHINVDEAQDMSLLQHKILRLLSSNSYLFMVGDEDQSIYSFRGANPKQLLDFSHFYGNKDTLNTIVLKLEENFRSTSKIVHNANIFIKQVSDRYDKEMFSLKKGRNEIIKINISNYVKQYKLIPKIIEKHKKHGTIGIIYKNNETGLLVSKYLLLNGLTFNHNILYSSFKNSKITNELISFIKFINNPNDIVAFSTIYKRLGLNDAVFAYVSSNYGKYNNIIKALNTYKSKDKAIKTTIRKIIKYQNKLNNQPPQKILKCFLHNFSYLKYIEWLQETNVLSANVLEKIHILNELLYGLLTMDEFYKYMDNIINASNSESNIFLSTIHAAKGLEFDTIILVDFLDGVIPSTKSKENRMEAIEAEARLFYVAVTRAKSHIILFKSKKYNNIKVNPSTFLMEFYKGELFDE